MNGLLFGPFLPSFQQIQRAELHEWDERLTWSNNFIKNYKFRKDPTIIDDNQRQDLKLSVCVGRPKLNYRLALICHAVQIASSSWRGCLWVRQYYNNNSLMLGKLAQIRNYISHAITSLESQRPLLPTDPALPKKLDFFLNHVMKAALPAQFKAYHQLQAPEIALNELLPQLYHSPNALTEQITAILHFYTFLLLNCQNQLVLCKIVSDPFVLELTEVFPDRLHQVGESPLVDLQELNSYKIALVKAYVSRLGTETAKYMVVGERMRIFESCVSFCVSFQGQRQWGVEITCMSNCLLLITKFVAEHEEYTTFCFQQQGMSRLLIHLVSLIHASIQDMLTNSGDFEEQLESLRSAILFTIDLIANIHNTDYRSTLIENTFRKLTDLRELFWQLVEHFTSKQDTHDYMQILELIKVLLKLMAIYFKIDELTVLFERSLLPTLDKFILSFTVGLQKLTTQSEYPKVELKKQLHLFCSISEILALILQEGGYLWRRKSATKSENQLKALVVTRIIEIIELLLSEQATMVAQNVCSKSVKLLLLSLMQLTVENYHTLHQYSVLRLHQYYINHLKKNLKKIEVWDYVVLHYELLLKQASLSLLLVDSIEPNEYQHCQSHDPYRTKQESFADLALNAILLSQYTRSFRFMIVETTYVPISSIKLEKSYHTNFISPGWDFQPGKEVEGEAKEMCRIVHVSNDLQIPITVISDEECLIFAHYEENKPKKVILNIRYKVVEGFTMEKQILRIHLKAAQEILVQGQKAEVEKFKGYLIEKRDKARQRELKFIHHSLDIYHQDNLRVIAQMGEKEIEGQVSTQQDTAIQQDPQSTTQVKQQQITEPIKQGNNSQEEPSSLLL